MITWGLIDGFGRLPVRLAVVDIMKDPLAISAPGGDVALLHATFAGNNGFTVDIARIKARYKKLVLFLEAYSPLVDHVFTYRADEAARNPARTTYVRMPAPLELLVRTQPPQHQRIMLDHDWPVPEHHLSYMPWLYECCAPLVQRGYSFAQLGQREPSNPPLWLEIVPPLTYAAYVAALSKAGTFVVTHSGSYNHSIVDAACLGLRVLARRGAVCADLVRNANVLEFDDGADFMRLLQDHRPPPDIRARCTEFRDVVRMMDMEFKCY